MFVIYVYTKVDCELTSGKIDIPGLTFAYDKKWSAVIIDVHGKMQNYHRRHLGSTCLAYFRILSPSPHV